MKKLLPLLSLVAAAAILAGCLPSLHPYYTEKDLTFDEGLIGSFSDKNPPGEQDEIWKFSRHEEKFYHVEILRPKDDTGAAKSMGEMKAALFKLGDGVCLDLQPVTAPLEDGYSGWYYASFIPGHVIWKIHKVEDGGFTASAIEYDWLDKLLKNEPAALAHKRDDDRLILTATTAELRAFFQKHEKEIWAESGKMVRLKQ